MDKLKQIMEEIRPDVDFENEKKLIDDGILDSFDIISIVSEVNEEFNVHINVNDLKAENFNSLEALYSLIFKLQGK